MLNMTILTVSQVNSYIKLLLQGDKNLKNIFVSGEISNFKPNYLSGHAYFSLKENGNLIKAVIFSENFKRLKFIPADGMNVIIRGTISLYEVTGQYQLYVEDMQLGGVGEYYFQLEKLKEKLKEEGLFDSNRKKSLPKYPKKIGVVTSVSGAVVHDIKKVIKRRYPFCEIEVFPVQVQGNYSEEKIIDALKYFNSHNIKPDVIIIARGGGSAEDLSVFNKENVARAVADSQIPIISAVGHETDWTICDYVADVRAATPSSAAELAVPDKEDILSILYSFKKRIFLSVKNIIETRKVAIEYISKRYIMASPKNKISFYKNQVHKLKGDLDYNLKNMFLDAKLKLDVLESRLNEKNPIKRLLEGYAIVYADDEKICSISKINEGQKLNLKFIDGNIDVIVQKIRSETIER